MAWCKLGDKNTRFFHLQCLNRWRKNSILKISDGAVSFHDTTSIKRIVVDHFKDRFCKQSSFCGMFPNMPLQSLPSEIAESLEMPFSLEEIKSAVWQCDSSKALGPNGVNFYVYKRAWSLVKEDLFRLFDEFFISASLPSSIHASFSVLSMVFIKLFLRCWLLGSRKYSL